jgi:hypothetical protein
MLAANNVLGLGVVQMLEPLEPPPEQDERLPLPQPERKQQQHHHHHLRRTNSASF